MTGPVPVSKVSKKTRGKKGTRKAGPVTCPVSVSEVSNTGVSDIAGESCRGET